MTQVVFGKTQDLKPSHVKALTRLAERRIPAELVISRPLARDLLELSHELNRQIGLFVDRRGRIQRVILGDAHSLDLPEFERVRGVAGRLRGVRLVLTHLVSEELNREELADLAKLRLDMIAGLHQSPGGIQVDLAALAPSKSEKEAFTTHVWRRTPLSLLAPNEVGKRERSEELRPDLPLPLDEYLRELEHRLTTSTATARAQSSGTRAMLLQVHPGGKGSSELQARQAELDELCRTAGVEVVDRVVQRRKHPDPKHFLGSGKIREVLIRALEQDVELLICDPELNASQAREISAETDIKVIDRTMLILDIFAQHAKSSDGKLQVELAQLRYRLPKMVGKGTMMSRLAGGIGGRGPGESKLEIDRRRAQKRISDLEHRLKHLHKQREQQRQRRRRSEVPVVAIVGYTNAGKSTLLNTVTRSEVRAENKLFATLDPTVRRIRFPADHEIVMLDTVGFIRDLPPALMQAFSATLEEISDADLILHVIDASDPDCAQQIETVESLLEELEAREIERFLVFNKVDQLESPPDPNTCPANHFYVSALDRRSTRKLMESIEGYFWTQNAEVNAEGDNPEDFRAVPAPAEQ